MQETTWGECMANIFPVLDEIRAGTCPREHLIDDYLVTQNIARYGLKVSTVIDLCKQINHPPYYFFHLYACSYEDKVSKLTAKAKEWGI